MQITNSEGAGRPGAVGLRYPFGSDPVTFERFCAVAC